ncbi:MAG: calcium-translocating P-type ATPase, SERCA-type [Bacillota bacterium]
MGKLHWHGLDNDTVLELLGSSWEGLTSRQCRERLDRYGLNVLETGDGLPVLRILLDQFKDFMVMMLLAATAVAALLGEVADAVTIVVIVVLNAVLGFVQEYRAERSLHALKRMTAPVARALRDGAECVVPAEELVPGDIIQLGPGDRVPADARILHARALEVDQSLLTGESLPVAKHAGVLPGRELASPDWTNMVFMGTVVTQGRARGVVVATGMETEMGAIAETIEEAGTGDTPLQRRLDHLGRYLGLACLLVCGLVVAAGITRGESWFHMFLAGVSLAVAAIPEGLPAVVTVALALGVQRMAARSAIVRRLPAVETLGCATLICSDKTGTLTKNEMTLREVTLASGARYEVSGSGYSPEGQFSLVEGAPAAPDLALILTAGAICNNARLLQENVRQRGRIQRKWKVSGDPTEGALLVAAAKLGLDGETLSRCNPRVDELPFSAERRCMSVVVQRGAVRRAYIKGAPDTVMGMCSLARAGDSEHRLDAGWQRRITGQADTMAGQALRVLALAYRDLPATGETEIEKDAVFLGIVGLLDPPRPEAVLAVSRCRQAGIRPVMITGDHPATAAAVARETGLMTPGTGVLTGAQLDALDDPALARHLEHTSVYARVSPQHKLRLIRAFRAQGHVVAMTGDGVNDAPAVKEADIGIAMGLSGTDVTKEASDMILADDNFRTIVAAVEEGRAIYDNIRKFIRYLLSCNVGEVLVMLAAVLLGWPLPLIPMQILWVNLVTDGLPAMALGVDPADPDNMRRPPRRSEEGVFSRGLGIKIAVRGIMIAAATALTFGWCLGQTGDVARARTVAFVTLVFCQLFHVFECRSETRNVFSMGLTSNPWLVVAVTCSVAMTLVAATHPALQPHFQTRSLTLEEWMAALAVSGLMLVTAAVRHLLAQVVAGIARSGVERHDL